MEGYSVTEAASVLGVPTERVWELLARGILSGASDGETGMRVFLQPRPAPQLVDEPRRSNGHGNARDSDAETSPFRELLTEFRGLTERYGQALLALGEARGEVASLRSRVDVLEARMDLRLPFSSPMTSEPTPRASDRRAPAPAEAAERGMTSEPEAAVDVQPDAERSARRRRTRAHFSDEFAEALARAEDPSPAVLRDAPEAEKAVVDAHHGRDQTPAELEAADWALPRELPAAEAVMVAAEPESEPVPEPERAEPEPAPLEPELQPAVELEPAAGQEPEPEHEPVGEAQAESLGDAELERMADLAQEPEPERGPEPALAVAAEPSLADEVASEPEPEPEAEPGPPPTLVLVPDLPSLPEPEPEAELVPTSEAAAVLDLGADMPEPEPVAEAEPAEAPSLDADMPEPEPVAEAEPELVVGAVEPRLAEPEPTADAPPDSVIDAEPEQATQVAFEPAAGFETELAADIEPDEEPSGRPAFEPEPAVGAVASMEAEPSAEASWDQETYSARIEEPDWWSPEESLWPEPQASSAVASPEAAAEEDRPIATEREQWAGPDLASAWPAEESGEPSAPDEMEASAGAVAEGDSVDPPEATAAATVEVDEHLATPEPYLGEETMLWFGRRPDDSGSTVSPPEDAAGEMEVASTGHRGRVGPERPTGFPGGEELDDALAGLDSLVARRGTNVPGSGSLVPNEAQPRSPPIRPRVGDEPVHRPPQLSVPSGPATRAYRRLRRIFPG